MEKLSHQVNSEWVDYSHKPEYQVQQNRLEIGLQAGKASVVAGLVNLMEEPLFILYVLHTSRGEGQEGRYQSPLLSKIDVLSFIEKYSKFLAADSRFDIWFHSPSMGATVVWDRHNLVFAYGALEQFKEYISHEGYTEGNPTMEFAHQHHYRQAFDHDAASLLNKFSWSFSPLQQADIQRV
jgi:hypothetical protein